MPDPTLDLSSLTDNGDTLDLGDGRTLRLLIKPDEDASINDYDADGRVDASKERPADFDGNAEKLHMGDYTLWWQPPADSPKRGTPEFEEMRRHVLELIEFGFYGVVLEVLQGTDAYDRPIVTHSASLWAIESLERDYLATVVGELATELELS
jgi:hypothetical protein